MVRWIRSRAPVRISFAGGGTDVPPYPQEHGGCVLSATINKYSFTSLKVTDSSIIKLGAANSKELLLKSVEDAVLDGHFDLAKSVLLEMKPEKGLELFFRNDVKPRSGLGSSGAGFVSLLGAYSQAFEQHFSRHEIANLALELERTRLNIKGGKQDQFASAYGGINFIEFNDETVFVRPMELTKNCKNELEKQLVLVYTRDRKNNGTDIIEDQTRGFMEKEKNVLQAFHSSKQIALKMRECLKKENLEEFGKLLHKGWIEKKKYSPLISDSFIDGLYETAQSAGAVGGKLTGAGGGGYMLFYCHPDREIKVREALEKKGAVWVPFSFEFEGLQTWEVNV
ncbi:GHMP kinase [Candidatus Micrarchaeota archaeon]|nr:GHMP kinase [Candidatus Micrarchaeota archaeon]MBU1930518.1 GHMP kinase [Candidatus Micrarchaeota archaeon]